ncbi:MAG: Ig-like domain-containing protein [Terriglobales bacterium]
MIATTFAAKISASSLNKQFQRVLLLSALVAMTSLSALAQIVVSPASETFTAKQLIDTTSASKSVTITNNGASAQAISIVMSGDYTETDNCSGSVAGGGGSCTLKISFAPTLVGTIEGAASIYDTSKNLLAFVGLKGTGEAPVTASPASLSFTAGTIGTTSAAKTFKITNNTAANVTINSITTNVSDYTITTGTCLTAAILPTKFCTVTVQVTPTSAADDGAIIITDNAPNAVPQVVKLTSAATAGTSPISLSKTSLTFKALSGTTSAAQTITVTNTSGSTVTLGTITASADFAISATTCTSSLAAAGTCTISIEFEPTFIGSIGGAVAIPVNSPNIDSPQLVNVTGTSEANLTVAPASLTFTAQGVGTTSTAKSVKITNNTSSAVTLSSIVPADDFQIQLSGTTCSLSGGTLAAKATCTIEIQFAPTIAGSVLGSLTVTNTSSPDPLIIGLAGTGTITATAVLNPASAHQGSSETIVITGTNTNFSSATTVNFGANITTGTVSVNGPTSASVPITIAAGAATGARNVTITTGAQVVTTTFTVIAGVPAVTVISPNKIGPTQTEPVTVTGAFTNWVNGTTKANFGPGIAVGGAAAGAFGPVTVTNATTFTASLVTSGATTGFRPVQVQTSSQTLTVNNGIDVETCNGTAPTVLQISPGNTTTNVPLNSQVQVQFSVPMNRSTFSLGNTSGTTIFFYDTTSNTEIPGTVSLDASGTIATIIPSEALPAGREIVTYLSYETYVQDACGVNLGSTDRYFYTAFSPNLTGPSLTGTSPVSGDTNIPLNGTLSGGTPTPVVLQFSAPIDPITAQTGFTLTTGGNAVPGNFSYSTNDETVTFTPVNPLTASTVYTVSYTAQITDNEGNALTNPGSFTFTTGTAADSITPVVTLADPPNNSYGVGLNVTPHLTFNEAVNGLSVPGSLTLYYGDSNLIVPTTITVAANRLSATVTPSAPLLPDTYYYLYLCGYTDISGNYGTCYEDQFWTGTSAITTPVTVTTINPNNGQTGVPLNAQITAAMSNTIDPTSISNSSITVTPSGGAAIAGTVTLTNGVDVTFVPSAALTASKVYNVSVGGFNDIDGNAVTTFTSSFTTGTTTYGSGSFSVVSVSPANGATGVSVTSPVTFTMTNNINAASVNANTVYVYDTINNAVVAGSYNVSGAAVTFTPLNPYPASTQMGMCAYGIADEAGNLDYQCYDFTTGTTVDTTVPTVTITPTNGAANVGLNTPIVLAFSKSINPTTITTNTLALFNGDTAINYNYNVSRDSRTIVVNYNGGTLTPGATLTIELTSGIQDLSGNALANTSSQFTLTTLLSSTAPQVVVMRPGNGATNVPASTVVTLFTNAAMNASTIAGALYVTDNGVVVSGTTQLASSGQAIEFTPSAPFNAGDLIQVTLNSTALSADGVALGGFEGQFRVAGSPANTTATVLATNPVPSATGVPLNTIIQVEYNQALTASTLNNTSVTLYQYSTGTYLTPKVTLVGTQVINIAPTSNLVASSQYQVYISANNTITNTDGKLVQPYAYNFTAGTATDTAAPTITSEAPTNNATNIGTNALVSVNFNKAINPVSVTGSTIQLTAGATTEVPSSISFSPDYTRVSVTPQAPLPPGTQVTITVNGVTSEAGKAAAKTTTTFTTAAQPVFTTPYVVRSSVQSNQTNVPVNSVFSMTFSAPMDIGSNGGPTDVYVYDNRTGQYATTTVSWSSDQTTIFLVPSTALAVGSSYQLGSYYMTDLSGNPQQNFGINFTTSFSANTNPPTVINTSPENSETAVPVNAPVQILFSEPIQPTSIGSITVMTGGNPVAVTPTFSDANQLLTLTPTLPLLASNATYTITITGVKDTAGNTMTGTVTNTFTTGPTFNLIHPSVTVVDPPANSTGVGTNVTPRITFSTRLNPLSVVSSSNELYNYGSVELYNNSTGQYVPATVSMTADRLTAIITPSAALEPNTSYEIYIANSTYYYDVAGNYGNAFDSSFVTGSGSDTTHATVTTISPGNAQTGVALNAQITAVLSDEIDPTTVTNSAITVTPSGGAAIAGTVAVASNGTTLTFTPSAALTASKVYNVSVGGFNDVQGNTVTTFTSSFTTGVTTYGSGSFTVVSVVPANGATGISVTSTVTFTMTNEINAASVNPTTVYVYDTNNNAVVAGSYNVSGATVTFTPLTQYPASTLMGMCVYGMTDEAGNLVYSCDSFTTGTTADHTVPTVTITPASGTTNAGLNTEVVLTFSKSINPATITQASVNLLNGDMPLNPATSISRDSRTVVLNYNSSTLPAGATLTVVATSLVTDLSGNALANTTSQFTTTSATLNSAPTVVSMRPGNGATLVPTNSAITLFTSAPMNSSSLSNALFVSQNGVLISGTTSVGSNGQSIEFTPSSALLAGTAVQVFLNSTAQDIYGNYLTYFSGQFTTAGSITNTEALVQALNPFNGATGVPLNTAIQVEYDQPLKASTLNNTSVTFYQYSTGTYLTPTVSLVGTQVVNIAPTSNLVAGSQYQVYVSSNNTVTNTDGVLVQPYAYNFVAGTATDTAAPTIVTLAPPNSATNIGTNAGVGVDFNKAINPVSVTGSSIQVSGGSVTEVPSSISFTTDYKRTMIIPQAPLPSSTQMAIAISGVTSQAGVAVASQTTHFTTQAGPDFTAPYVIHPSVQSGQTVGTNAVFAMQFSEPIDPGSVNPGGVTTDVYLYDNTTGTYVTTTISFSADLTTIFLKPAANLTASQSYQLGSYYVTDLAGNAQDNFSENFLTGTGTDTTGPAVQLVSPPSGATGVPINAPVDILFNEPISSASLAGVTLKQGSTVVPTTTSLYDGDQGIQLTPLVPLATGTVYTINVTGVLDITGNAQSSFSSVSFTTGSGADLTKPTIVSTNPTNGETNVPDNTTCQVVFSEAMDLAYFDPNNSFTLRTTSNTVVPATITFSAGNTTATLQPTSNLAAATQYYCEMGYQAPLYDLGGNQLSGTYISFTTH